jgi:hypothetical protein
MQGYISVRLQYGSCLLLFLAEPIVVVMFARLFFVSFTSITVWFIHVVDVQTSTTRKDNTIMVIRQLFLIPYRINEFMDLRP